MNSVRDVTGLDINSDWSKYKHVTDSGILSEFIRSNGLANEERIRTEVKSTFIAKLKQALASEAVREIEGASDFIAYLRTIDDVVLSIATGGWYESAVIKLDSAGIDFTNIHISSACDFESRIEIMKAASIAASAGKYYPCTYFGDGIWDQEACKKLGFNFVSVGTRLKHWPNIVSFRAINQVMEYTAR